MTRMRAVCTMYRTFDCVLNSKWARFSVRLPPLCPVSPFSHRMRRKKRAFKSRSLSPKKGRKEGDFFLFFSFFLGGSSWRHVRQQDRGGKSLRWLREKDDRRRFFCGWDLKKTPKNIRLRLISSSFLLFGSTVIGERMSS